MCEVGFGTGGRCPPLVFFLDPNALFTFQKNTMTAVLGSDSISGCTKVKNLRIQLAQPVS